MKARKGSATPLLSMALLVSVLINVAFVSGCYTCKCCKTDKDCEAIAAENKTIKAENAEMVAYVKKIARDLGLNTDKTSIDLKYDILEFIQKRPRKMPAPLSEKTIKDLETLLSKEEVKTLREYQKAIKDAQGKRVLYLPDEAE